APVAHGPRWKASFEKRPRVERQITSLLKLKRVYDVRFEPADNAREPRGAGRPAFRKPRRQHLHSVGAERQWPQSLRAKRLVCSVYGPARIAVAGGVLKIRMPGSFRSCEDVQIPAAPGNLVDPARGVNARRSHDE